MPFILDSSTTFHSSKSANINPRPSAAASSSSKMPFNPFRRSKSKKVTDYNSIYNPPSTPRSSSFLSRAMSTSKPNPFRDAPPANYAPPTTMPSSSSDAPPAYTPANHNTIVTGNMTTNPDSSFAFLSTFDTKFLIDDSGSMAGQSWRETAAAIAAIAPICTSFDSDGIDIYFLNQPHNVEFEHVTSKESVQQIFNSVRPRGGTPTGMRLDGLLRPYLRECEAKGPEKVKPINIIVITDGVPTDDVESPIISAARKLDRMDAPAWQIGIQFFQVGAEPGAAAALRELDDGLAEVGGVRDMVDTVPFKNGQGLTGDGVLKCVLGAVHRRWDRKKLSAESLLPRTR